MQALLELCANSSRCPLLPCGLLQPFAQSALVLLAAESLLAVEQTFSSLQPSESGCGLLPKGENETEGPQVPSAFPWCCV